MAKANINAVLLGEGTPPSMVIDGTVVTNNNTNNSSFSTTFSTTQPDTLIIVATNNKATSAFITSSPSASGLTFTLLKRLQYIDSTGQHLNDEVWYAFASEPLSSLTFTDTLSGSATRHIWNIMAFRGVDLVSPVDTNASIPATATSVTGSAVPVTVNISTDNTFTILLGFARATTGGPAFTVGSGWTNIVTDSSFPYVLQSKVVTAKQSSAAVSFTTNVANWGLTAFAMRRASRPQ